jgi:hypothetical protein
MAIAFSPSKRATDSGVSVHSRTRSSVASSAAFRIGAAALFPADQPTLELFTQAPQTVVYGPLLVQDFDLVRWAWPDQITLLGR